MTSETLISATHDTDVRSEKLMKTIDTTLRAKNFRKAKSTRTAGSAEVLKLRCTILLCLRPASLAQLVSQP